MKVGSKTVTWDSAATKWNGNLHGPRNAPELEYSFPKYPECEAFDPIVFGRPNMKNSENSTPGYRTPAPPKPADYHPTVYDSAGSAMDVSDEEEYEAIDFDSWDAGVFSCCFVDSWCIVDACAVYVQKAEPTPVTPVKSLGGVAVGGTAAPATPPSSSPATPPTSQKASAVKVERSRPALDALLKEMGIGLERVQLAALGKADAAGGLYVDQVKIILQHFNEDPSGNRPDLNSKLSLLLRSLGVQ